MLASRLLYGVNRVLVYQTKSPLDMLHSKLYDKSISRTKNAHQSLQQSHSKLSNEFTQRIARQKRIHNIFTTPDVVQHVVLRAV